MPAGMSYDVAFASIDQKTMSICLWVGLEDDTTIPVPCLVQGISDFKEWRTPYS
jgi:hypothetical protein